MCSDKPLVYVHEELRHSEDTEQLEVLALVCSVQVSTVQYSTVQLEVLTLVSSVQVRRSNMQQQQQSNYVLSVIVSTL